jgi:hypothetical protein
MIIEEFKEKLNERRGTLNKEQQKMLSLNSIENFLMSYGELKQYKQEVLKLLVSYFEEIESHDYIIDKTISNKIAFDYVMKIGTYYSNELGFKVQMKLQFVLMVGLHVDAALLITGVLRKVYYVPVTTLILLGRWLYLKTNYEQKHKVHNIRF